jgi:hypothetical protein
MHKTWTESNPFRLRITLLGSNFINMSRKAHQKSVYSSLEEASDTAVTSWLQIKGTLASQYCDA